MMQNISAMTSRIMTFLALGFLLLIPLYPKFPFISIPDTYISIRLEDFYLALMTGVLIIQVLQKKVTGNRRLVKLIILFWATVGVSFLINYAITHHIMYRNIGILHALRRIEYMIPFFVFYSVTRNVWSNLPPHKKKGLPTDRFLNVALWGVLLVCVYALGQKFSLLFEAIRNGLATFSQNSSGIISQIAYFFFRLLDFPAVQTMNSEFAKGHLLNLTPESRVSSTFAGHYDLAAYLVFFIPLVASLLIRKKHVVRNVLVYVLSIMTLILTASRASFGAFIVSMSLYFVYMRKWRALALTLGLTAILMFANKDLTSRFMDMFQKRRVFENVQTGAVIINQEITVDELPAGSEFVTESKPVKVMTEQDKQDLTKQLVKKEVEEARKSGKPITEAEATSIVTKKYQELQNFVVKDVVAGDTSLATRTQVEWPRAIKAFLTNPAVGTGPSSITESTDGDYFRWLGETGLLGTGLFVSILLTIGVSVFKKGKEITGSARTTMFAFSAGLIALAANALLIDVFEASKVAYIFWAIAGVFMATVDEKKLPDTDTL